MGAGVSSILKEYKEVVTFAAIRIDARERPHTYDFIDRANQNRDWCGGGWLRGGCGGGRWGWLSRCCRRCSRGCGRQRWNLLLRGGCSLGSLECRRLLATNQEKQCETGDEDWFSQRYAYPVACPGEGMAPICSNKPRLSGELHCSRIIFMLASFLEMEFAPFYMYFYP